MYSQKCTFIFFMIVAVVVLGTTAEPPQKIMGGVYAGGTEFPYLVSLRRLGRHHCGGSIISPQHILTAAHCLQGVHLATLSVVTGTNRLSDAGIQHFIKRAVIHPQYMHSNEYSYHNDIAILTLTYPLKFNSKQSPIKLASQDLYLGRAAVVAGWGRFHSTNPMLNNNLMKLSTKVEDISYCRKKLGRYLYDEQLCAVQPYGQGICMGDSGGPLVVNGEIVGIASFVLACGAGYPDVYTRVFAYRSFIQKEMRP